MKKFKIRKPEWMKIKSPIVRGIIGIVIFLVVAAPTVMMSFYWIGRLTPLVLPSAILHYLPINVPINVFWANVFWGTFYAAVAFVMIWCVVVFIGAVLVLVFGALGGIYKAGIWTGNLFLNNVSSARTFPV